MKTKINVLIAIMLFSVTSLFADELKKEEFKVYGNCGMCETRIEKAATSLDGVSEAEWNKKTKMIEVTFDPNLLEVKDIEKAIAKVGHDTESENAKDGVYNELPGCCQYERKVD